MSLKVSFSNGVAREGGRTRRTGVSGFREGNGQPNYSILLFLTTPLINPLSHPGPCMYAFVIFITDAVRIGDIFFL